MLLINQVHQRLLGTLSFLYRLHVYRIVALLFTPATGGDSLFKLLRPLYVLSCPWKPQCRKERQNGPGHGEQEEGQVVADLKNRYWIVDQSRGCTIIKFTGKAHI